MAVKGVDAILIDSHDVAGMAKFYRDDLGLPLNENKEASHAHWECDFGGVHFAIHQKLGHAKSSRNVGFSLAVDDVDKLVKTLKERKMLIDMEPVDRPYGRLAAVHDPDGNLVYLHQQK